MFKTKAVRCISERKSLYGQIVVGEVYYLAEDTIWEDADGDEYAMVYSDADGNHKVGYMLTSHFEHID